VFDGLSECLQVGDVLGHLFLLGSELLLRGGNLLELSLLGSEPLYAAP
jgi:hypothetical protein